MASIAPGLRLPALAQFPIDLEILQQKVTLCKMKMACPHRDEYDNIDGFFTVMLQFDFSVEIHFLKLQIELFLVILLRV